MVRAILATSGRAELRGGSRHLVELCVEKRRFNPEVVVFFGQFGLEGGPDPGWPCEGQRGRHPCRQFGRLSGQHSHSSRRWFWVHRQLHPLQRKELNLRQGAVDHFFKNRRQLSEIDQRLWRCWPQRLERLQVNREEAHQLGLLADRRNGCRKTLHRGPRHAQRTARVRGRRDNFDLGKFAAVDRSVRGG